MTDATPILFTIPNFTTAGSGRAMLNIVERLDRRRFAPTICTLKPGGNLEAEIERLGIPYIHGAFAVPARPLATLAVRAHRAAAAFRSRGFVLWHSFHYLDDYTEPLVARFAGAKAWIYTKKNMNWNRRSWWLRSVLATRVAAQNTDMIRDFFASRRLRRKTVLVPRGVDTELFRPDVPRRLRLREKLGVPSDAVVAGCVAQLLPVKGHPTLIEALVRVPGLRLWLAGKELDERYASGLREKIRSLGVEDRVTFLGEVQDVPALLAELDVFVLPTWNEWRMEGCPVALLEAMSSARPCVATDIPGSRDIVQSERSGVLVPPQDPVALAQALNRMLADAPRRRALGEAARDRIRAHYAIEVEVRAHEDLYAGLLELAPARRAA